jgi:hypothetical protein
MKRKLWRYTIQRKGGGEEHITSYIIKAETKLRVLDIAQEQVSILNVIEKEISKTEYVHWLGKITAISMDILESGKPHVVHTLAMAAQPKPSERLVEVYVGTPGNSGDCGTWYVTEVYVDRELDKEAASKRALEMVSAIDDEWIAFTGIYCIWSDEQMIELEEMNDG